MTDRIRQYVTGEVLSSHAARFRSPARREVKFLFSKLQDLVPTNHDCYLTACNGSFCIIDRYRPAVAGSRVLIELNGKGDWAKVRLNPPQMVTDDGEIIQGEQLNEVTVIGVAIREVVSTYLHPRPSL
ncbi:hypothetical protein SD961_00805 [Erwinia sp. MMLR14_017]|uniref:hypothetical protein n=1 Tax=Erwinia sp. MMLR14_017 TaxID=3093842 RepID=UPI00299050A3|nr:hypothetical protein [Erwinia sp. MMLR14_017]MDW8844445.1 hypothetical protein [Erwinia sp. MMLR14_017]